MVYSALLLSHPRPPLLPPHVLSLPFSLSKLSCKGFQLGQKGYCCFQQLPERFAFLWDTDFLERRVREGQQVCVAEHAERRGQGGGGRGGQETHLSAFLGSSPAVCPGSVSQAWNPPGITSCSHNTPPVPGTSRPLIRSIHQPAVRKVGSSSHCTESNRVRERT